MWGLTFIFKTLYDGGTSLVVQWLKVCTSNARGMGLILARKLRSHIPHGKKKKKKNFIWWCLQGQKDYNSLSYIPMKDIMKKTDCTIKILYESDFCNSISRISLQSDKPWVQRVYYAWSHILSFCVCVAKLCGMQQDPGSLTRNQTHSLCSGRAESQPLDPQGSPPLFPFLKDE